MKTHPRSLMSIVALLLISFIVALPAWTHQEAMRGSQITADATASRREDAYRANNLGVALLEQFNYKEGAEAFRRALQLDPKLAIAQVNLAIALYNVPETEAALREAKTAAELAPNAPQPHYILGLIARAQNRTDDAAAAFQRVLQIDARDVGANVNVGQLYAQQRKYADAIASFRTAIAAEPYNATAAYNLATGLMRAGQQDEGQRMLKRFQELRQSGAGTTIGQNYLEQGRYAEAITSTGAEPELVDGRTPDVTFRDATASVISVAATSSKGQTAGSGQGGNNTAASGFGQRVPAALNDDVKGKLTQGFGSTATLFDYDVDGDLDLFEIAASAGSVERLYRNENNRFVDVTAQSGIKANGIGTGAVAGDYDNDGRPDLFVLRYGASALYHNDGDGKFSDVTAAAEIPGYPHLSISAALVDADHDGDLDIFIAGFADLAADLAKATKGSSGDSGGSSDAKRTLLFPDDFAGAPHMLLRNNGNGKFTDITAAAKITGPLGHSVAVVPTDYDNRRDVDLLVLNYGAPPTLFRNLRDGSFSNVTPEVGLETKAGFTCAAAGDVNKDGYTDFFFGAADAPGQFAISDNQGRFVTTATPPPVGSEGASAAQFLDYDNDGLLDLVAIAKGAVRVWRNAGGKWIDTSAAATQGSVATGGSSAASPTSVSPNLLAARVLASGDTDADGDVDLITRAAAGELKFMRNEGGNRNRSVRVQLAGKVSNRSGVGAKIESRSGSLKQKLETYAASPAPAPADVIFGLGKRTTPDAVRVLWPAGIVQAETEIASATTTTTTTEAGANGRTADAKTSASTAAVTTPQKLTVTELDRKPSSCPYLFTWNGKRFEFITDFMGGGEMGAWVAPGVRNQPDPDEYVRIREDQLRARNGVYQLRVTNELEEALFMDRLKLIAVAHPSETEVFPNEGLTAPPHPAFKLYATRGAYPPAAATDDHGCDVRARIAELDRKYPDDFRLHPIRGYSETHTLTLDLGKPVEERTLLLLTGWTDYAFSSDNVAAGQSGLKLMPPALQVKDENGNWQTVMPEIGLPIGRPQTVLVDLTNKFLSSSREVRIITNMRVYWDQILVDTSGSNLQMQLTALEPLTADLRWRGFSREISPDKREPFAYDHSHISFASPWKVMPGRYTREGNVRELLGKTDDMFIVSRSGDEIAVSFDATKLPALPHGWKRTFLLYVNGFSKEMDINSSNPDAVTPLPFHGMTSYPYNKSEHYPMTRAHQDYIERYNTRIVTAPVPHLLVNKN